MVRILNWTQNMGYQVSLPKTLKLYQNSFNWFNTAHMYDAVHLYKKLKKVKCYYHTRRVKRKNT